LPTTQPNSVRERRYRRRDFNDLHDEVIKDKTKDERYNGGVSNAVKADYICRVLAHPREAFDLDLPFPYEDWAKEDNQGKINAGLYLCDLRVQFYGAVLERSQDPHSEVWLKHAEAEFWCEAFNTLTHVRQFGYLLEDDRDIN